MWNIPNTIWHNPSFYFPWQVGKKVKGTLEIGTEVAHSGIENVKLSTWSI